MINRDQADYPRYTDTCFLHQIKQDTVPIDRINHSHRLLNNESQTIDPQLNTSSDYPPKPLLSHTEKYGTKQ